MGIKFGPAGIGSIKDISKILKSYNKKSLKAAEIPFTYQVFIKKKKDAIKIKKAAEKYKIDLSIHAPYWINLNSTEKEKIKSSQQRILKSCEIGHYLGVKKIIFHSGYYGKMGKEETFQNIKKSILKLQEIIKKKKWKMQLCPEVMGKINVFGSLDEISRLVEETGCGFCIDFAHSLARYGDYNMSDIKKKFPQKNWHCHFSGIEYGKKGEKKHKRTPDKEIKRLISLLPSEKNITIINESPSPIEDSIKCIEIYSKKPGVPHT